MQRQRERIRDKEKSSAVAGRSRETPIVPLLRIRCKTENILQTDRGKLIRYKLKCRGDDIMHIFDGKGGDEHKMDEVW